MRQRYNYKQSIALRAIVAAGFIGAFLFTMVLAVTPQLHERLHNVSADASHECAATLLSSGNCEHAPFGAVVTAPLPAGSSAALSRDNSQILCPHLEFSLLEHAPPANA